MALLKASIQLSINPLRSTLNSLSEQPTSLIKLLAGHPNSFSLSVKFLILSMKIYNKSSGMFLFLESSNGLIKPLKILFVMIPLITFLPISFCF